MDFYGALVFLDFLLINHGGKEGAAEDVQIQVVQCSAQAGFGFEVGCIEFPAFHEDAFFFLVGDCFAGSYANPDAAAEAYGREFGGLNLNDGNVSFRKGDSI